VPKLSAVGASFIGMTRSEPPARALRSGGRAAGTYRCVECGWQAPRWAGRCGECQAWGTVDEVGAPVTRGIAPGPVTAAAVPIGAVDIATARARSTGIGELDRVLGGGLVPGAVVLLAGEPGIGKSTLFLEAAARAASPHQRSLVVSGEESAAQVRLRAERIGAVVDELFLAAETDLAAVLGHVDAVRPQLLVVDSVQTVAAADVEGAPGGITQVRRVTGALIQLAKERGITVLLIGHVTKDGAIAGPRVLEHLVDVVIVLDGERHSRLRMVRAVKNRYGPSDEVGCFDLGDNGLTELPDPSGMFLSNRAEPVPGTSVTVTLEGSRPLVAEVQALVATSALATPRRASVGLESSRIAMILAVLERRAGVRLAGKDVYAATVGGVRITEPATDLALALAVAGAVGDRPLPSGSVALGEVGLAGDIRPVSGVDRRLVEAARLGFTQAIVPPSANPTVPPGMTVTIAADLASAVRTAFAGDLSPVSR
jgi:DNA repair protein RadA/Sms